MIRKLLSKVLFNSGHNSSVSRKTVRRLGFEPLETRRLLAATGAISGFVFVDPSNAGQMSSGSGFPGMTVELHTVGSGGTLSGDGYVQTQTDGSYRFSGLAAGSYEVQIEPSSKIDVGTPISGSASGTAGTNDIQLTLTDGQSATGNNFDLLGVPSSYVSNRMFLASTGTFEQFVSSLDTAPTVNLGTSGTSYTTGAAADNIASSATITQGDSPTLTSMTVTLASPPDGTSEVLTATKTNPALTTSYANGVLTISGVANLPTYQSVLDSITYSDSSSSATAGTRTVSVVVNDGTKASTAATTTVAVTVGTNIAPTVTSVSTTQAAGSYGVGATIPITVTFSNTANVTGTPQLALNDNGAVATYASGTGTSTLTFNYTIAAGQTTSDLDYASTSALTLNGGTIQSTTGTAATLTLPATGTDGLATKNIVVDTTTPAVTSVSTTQAAGAYSAGTTIPITVTFGEAVNVTGTPQLALNDNGAVANYASGSGSSTLTFNYTIAAGQNTSDLDYASTSALTLNGGTIKNAASTAATLTLPATGSDGLATKNIVIDTTAPTIASVSSTKAAGLYGTGTTIPVTITFSEAVNVTGTPQLLLNDGGIATYSSGSGTTALTFNYVVAANDVTTDLDYASTSALLLNGGSIKDVAGNAATLTLPATSTDGLATQEIAIDATPRTVSSVSTTQATGAYPASTTIPIAVTFGEAMTVTGTPEIALNDGGSATYVSGSGTTTLTFDYVVASGQNTDDLDYASTAALTLNGGTIKDASGNPAVLTLPATGTNGLATKNIQIETSSPTVTAVSTTQAAGIYSTGATIPVIVTFSHAVNVTGTPQLTLGNGAVVNYTSGSGTDALTFSYTVAAGQDTQDLDYASTTALALNGGTIQDTVGNVASLTLPATGSDGLATKNIIIDTTPRTVTGVSTTQATGAYIVATTIPITVTFGEAMTVTGTPKIALNDGGSATYVSGSGTATLTFDYTVAAGQNTADLDYASSAALTLNGGTIKDPAGNAADLTLPATGSDGLATKTIVIDTTPPAVTGVSTTQATGSYPASTTIPIMVTFGEAVNVTGTPEIVLNDGGLATYASGSGTATLTFDYTVVAGQNTQDLDYASTGSLSLNGGTIKDVAGNAATLTLPAPVTDSLATKDIVIETTPPNVTAVSTTHAGGTFGAGTTIPVTIAFSNPVTVTGTPQLTLNDGALVNYTSGSGTSTLTFSYSVAAGENTSDLDYASTAALALNGGTVKDAAGNVATLTLPTTGTDGLATKNIVIDTVGPVVTAASTTKATGFYPAGTTVPIAITFNFAVTVTGTPQLTLNDGGVANYLSGSGTSTLTFNYIAAAGQNTSDLDYASTSALSLNGGTIKDSIGNPAALTLPATGTDGLATKNIAIETTAPTGYSVTPNTTVYGISNADGASITINNAIVGDTYNYTVTSNNGGTPLTGTGTVTATSQVVLIDLTPKDGSGAALPTVADGTLTFSVKLTDKAGNVGAAATATATKLTKAPPAFTVTPDVNPVTNPTNFGFTLTGAETNTTFSWYFIYQGSTSVVKGSGTVTASTMDVTGLNISSLPSAAYTLHVILTDIAGNATSENAPVTINKPVPPFTISTSPYVNASTVTNAGFSFANAEALTTYKVTITSNGGGGTVTRSGNVGSPTQAVSGINLSSLPDGTLTYSVVITDTEGNVSSPVTTTAILDKVAPSGYTITANQPNVNLSNRTNTSFTFNNNAEVGDTYKYNVTTNGSTVVSGTGTITTAAQTISGIDVSSLADGTLNYSVNLTDPAGNLGFAAVAHATLDSVTPSGYHIAAGSPFNNAATKTDGGFVFSGATVNDTFHYSITSTGGGTPIGGNGTITSASQSVSGINLTGLGDGTLTYSVQLFSTPGGNPGATVTATATLDTVAPSAFTVAPLTSVVTSATVSSTGFAFSNAEVGDTYQYSITSTGNGTPVTGSGTVTAANQTVSGINLSGLGDGMLSFNVTLTDPAGNTGAAPVATATLDRLAPFGYAITADPTSINGSNVADAGFDLTGGATGDTYNFSVTSSGGAGSVTGSGVLTASAETISGINVSTLHDGTLTFSVTLTSGGHTGAAATASATLLANAPSGFTVTPDQSTINANAVSSTGFTLGSAKAGDTYHFTITGTSGSVTGSGNVTAATQDITGIDLSALPNGPVTFSVTLTDPLNNTSNPVTASATIDTSAPASIALSTSSTTASSSTAVGLFETTGGTSGSAYTYSLVSGAGSTDNGSFSISGDQLATSPTFTGAQGTYNIRVQSTDAQGTSIQQQFTITVNASDPIGATLTFPDGSTFIFIPPGAGGTFSGTVADLKAGGAIIGNQVTYSLVSGTGSDNNGSFQIVGNQLETSGALAPGTYSVRIRSSSTFLLSDVVDLSNVGGPYAFQVSLDPTILPASPYSEVAASAGLITMSTDGAGTGNWVPAVSANKGTQGQYAQTNYQGSYASFVAAVQAAHPSAALADIVGSSGVDLTNNVAWAVVNQPGEYAVADTVFTEQVFTITVT